MVNVMTWKQYHKQLGPLNIDATLLDPIFI